MHVSNVDREGEILSVYNTYESRDVDVWDGKGQHFPWEKHLYYELLTKYEKWNYENYWKTSKVKW